MTDTPKIEPCFFCEADCFIDDPEKHDGPQAVECTQCLYVSKGYQTEAEAIATHNSIAIAVREHPALVRTLTEIKMSTLDKTSRERAVVALDALTGAVQEGATDQSNIQ